MLLVKFVIVCGVFKRFLMLVYMCFSDYGGVVVINGFFEGNWKLWFR